MKITDIFAKNWIGAPFDLFGPAHLTALGMLVLLNLWLLRFRGAPQATRRIVRISLAAVLLLNETGYHFWKAAIGQWTIQEMLPLHLCTILIWLSGIMLLTRNRTIYDFAYFLGIGGGINALITPDAGIYGFPHYRFFQPLFAHGLLVTAALYMTLVEGFRPTLKSLGRVIVVGNLYAVVIYFINTAIGSNYLMVNHKPNVPSLYDFMPPWPWYLFFIELMAIGICLLLYLPFWLQDRRAAQSAS